MADRIDEIFVVMPFGTKSLGTLSIDFDHIYHELIRKAGEEAGWRVTRIDEVAAPGPISEQYLQRLFQASIVIADVSMPNGNVFYELGIRHAISTGLTLMTALDGTQLPFDIAHLRVFFYKLDDLGRTRALLVRTLSDKRGLSDRPEDLGNPVRTFLEKLGTVTSPKQDSAAFAQDLVGRIERAKTVEQLLGVWAWARNLSPLPALALIPLAERLAEYGEWSISTEVLRVAIDARPDDFEIHRKLGWHLRHLGADREAEALQELETALQLNPNDPETLGMMGGLFKRRGEFARAADSYAAAYLVAPSSPYIQVNRAAMILLSQPNNPSEGLALYEELLRRLEADENAAADPWAEVVAGEAAFVLGRDDNAKDHFQRARSLTRSGQELRSVADQLDLLSSVGYRSAEAKQLAEHLRRLASLRVLEVSGAPSSNVVGRQVPTAPVLVHLSDLHFGTKPGSSGAVEMHRFHAGDYEKTLNEHLEAEFSVKRGHFAQDHSRFFLIVSGDLAYQGTEGEFQLVREFLTRLCRTLDIPRDRVVLVPGNHDVHWPSASIDRQRRFDNYLGFLEGFYGGEIFRRLYPLVHWDFHVNSPRPSPEEIISIHHLEGFTVVGLNSCVYETEQHHFGFVGGRQLEHIETLLDRIGGTSTDFRVAVLHHHLHPFPEPVRKLENQEVWMDLSTIRDAGLVERRLEKLGFDLVLHGHKHKPQLRETLVHDQSLTKGATPRLLVCGAGSTGVNASELEHAMPNHYEVIEILGLPRVSGVDLLSIEWREIGLHAGAEWTTSRRWVLAG
jgi:3',5'-cyclic AMP phosphodiesterase CpdA/Tfp pilus assembly protein PilF